MGKNLIHTLIEAGICTHKQVEEYLEDYNKTHDRMIRHQVEQGQSVAKQTKKYSIIDNGVLIRFDERDLDEEGSYQIPHNVHKVNGLSFTACKNINTILMGDNLTAISPNAFLGCSVKYVDLNKVEIIGRRAFCNCENLEEIKLSSNLKYAGVGVFDKTINLQRFIEPSGKVINLSNQPLEAEEKLCKYINSIKAVLK